MQVLVHSIADACAVARVGKTAIYEAINSGRLPARKRGRRTLILDGDLRRYIDALPPLVPARQSGIATKSGEIDTRLPGCGAKRDEVDRGGDGAGELRHDRGR